MKSSKLPDYLFVAVQLILFVLYFWHPAAFNEQVYISWKFISVFPVLTGAFLITAAFIQLNRHLTMLPTPTEKSNLITTGVFKYIRHPIYSGIFLLALGYAVYLVDFNKLLFSLIILLFFDIKTGYEENQLTRKFSDYTNYKSITGKFFPRFTQPIQPNNNGTTSP